MDEELFPELDELIEKCKKLESELSKCKEELDELKNGSCSTCRYSSQDKGTILMFCTHPEVSVNVTSYDFSCKMWEKKDE